MSEQIQTQPYGIKLESTAKGVRMSVHIYGPEGLTEENRKLAIAEAVATFDGTVKELTNKGYTAESQPVVAK